MEDEAHYDHFEPSCKKAFSSYITYSIRDYFDVSLRAAQPHKQAVNWENWLDAFRRGPYRNLSKLGGIGSLFEESELRSIVLGRLRKQMASRRDLERKRAGVLPAARHENAEPTTQLLSKKQKRDLVTAAFKVSL
jgi:hypothetical protein